MPGKRSRRLLSVLLIAVSAASIYAVIRGFAVRSKKNWPTATSEGHSKFIISANDSKTDLDRQIGKADPMHDDWVSEIATAGIAAQLERLKQSVLGKATATRLPEIANEEFRGQLVMAERLIPIYDDSVLRVQRLQIGQAEMTPTASLEEQIASLTGSHPNVTNCSFKVVEIETSAGQAESRVRLQFVSNSETELQQDNLVCKCDWTLRSRDEVRLRRLEILEFERIVLAAGGKPMFADVTSSVLSVNPSDRDQIQRGVGDWSQRLTRIDDMHMYGHHGLAVGDVNNDLLDDLYVCDSGGLPNRLYVQQPDGTARDDSRQSKADWLEASTSALLIDLDNDGDQDLVVATIAALLLAANDGSGRFRVRAAQTGVPEAHSLCAADYDNDGDLDLYVCNYGPSGGRSGERGFEASIPLPYHDARNGGRNLLLQNQGDFKFRDVTDQVGLDENNRRWTFAAAWEDYDADGDIDLYVANDFGRNNLYQNQAGRFRDVAAFSGVEDTAAGMSVAWGDYNADGRSDLYVGNMFSAAGNRVTYQRRFIDSRPSQDSSDVQRMARGNTLFAAQPDGTFLDVSLDAGVNMGRWSWSSKFTDINNDGWQDLVVANGYFTNERTDDL